jgi:hypothetical protein
MHKKEYNKKLSVSAEIYQKSKLKIPRINTTEERGQENESIGTSQACEPHPNISMTHSTSSTFIDDSASKERFRDVQI